MKVILLTDVKGRGKEGDVIEVARGFAANYLLPRKMAVEATSGNLKQLESRMHNIERREEAKRSEAEGHAARIAGRTLVIEAKAGEEGKLFGSVTSSMVADAIESQIGVEVDRRRLDLHGHIKTIGEHTIDVRIYQDVTAEIIVNVVPEGGALVAGASTAAAVLQDESAPAEGAEGLMGDTAADTEPTVAEAPVADAADENSDEA